MPEPSPRRPLVRRVVRVVLLAVLFGFVAWVGASQWSEVREVIGRLSAAALGGSLVAALAASWCVFLAWRALMLDLGADVPLRGAMRIFFVGQLGKYVPGKVWTIVAQTRLGRDYGVPGRTSAAAALVVLGVSVLSGLGLTAVCLPVVGGEAWQRYWWTLLALPVTLTAMWPPVLNRLLAWTLRIARREPMPRELSHRGIGYSILWTLASWVLFGVHLWLLIRDLGGATGVALSVGAFVASWCVGFLLIVAPAGLGGREAALVLILGASVAQPVAVVAAVVSRLVLTITDVALPCTALALDRYRRRRLALTESP